ncbi:zinc ribbon domain-containing protein [Candidatus Woesearchaeota archaeon]|nr:zinc ribbon domain-containing protein [Candidatus Woesearchaeota archaeon]
MKKVREGHVAIPWSAYVAIGAGMSIYAKIIQSKNPDATVMALFFWLGIVMAVIGAGKYLLGKQGKEASRTEHEEQQSYTKQLNEQRLRWQQEQRRQQGNPAQHNVVACPRCGTKHYSTSNFCHKCGARLK